MDRDIMFIMTIGNRMTNLPMVVVNGFNINYSKTPFLRMIRELHANDIT
jgi:hypothetical protein